MQHSSYREPLDLETLKINSEIYNIKFAKEDGGQNHRSIIVLGKEIQDPLNQQQISESHKDFISQVKQIQAQLQNNQYIGMIYAPYKKEHVESFIISKDNLFITAPHNLNSKLKKEIELNFPSKYVRKLNTTAYVKNVETGLSEVRHIQSDGVSCGAIALKTLKTLLSKKSDGKLLVESLEVKKGNMIDPPADILKLSQSQKLVDEKIKIMKPEELTLSIGKHIGKKLSNHRLSFSRILNDDTKSNVYTDTLRQKYVEIANNTALQQKKGLYK